MTPRTKAFLSVSVAALLALADCSRPNPRTRPHFNQDAELMAAQSGELPVNPLRWKMITSGISRTDSTMYTLFGNDPAVEYARSNSKNQYPPGSTLSLVIWTQQRDPRWFGARIPSATKSVEFVSVSVSAQHQPWYTYQLFEGNPLRRVTVQEGPSPIERAQFLLSQRAAVMP